MRMQVERSYIARIVCPSCGGKGYIPETLSTLAFTVCPACLGMRIQEVKVTEGIA